MKRITAALTLCLMLMLTGCSGQDRRVVFTTGLQKDEVFKIEDTSCSLQEAMVYLVNTQMGYENAFGSDIWQAETDNGTDTILTCKQVPMTN